MKNLLTLMLLLLSGLTSQMYAGDKAICALEIRSAPVCLLGKDCESQCIGRGTAVAIDLGQTSNSKRQGLIFLTAAHCVTEDQKRLPNGKMQYRYHSPTVIFEVFINGNWVPAKLRNCSLYGDIALLSVVSDYEQPLICMSDKDAALSDIVTLEGFVLGLNYSKYRGCVKEVTPNDTLDILELTKDAVIPGQSGGCILNTDGSLVGIVTGYPGDKPWEVLYTDAGEIRRFLAAAWDKKFDQGPFHQNSPMPGRAQPRIVPDDGEEIDSKAPSSPVVPAPAPPNDNTRPENPKPSTGILEPPKAIEAPKVSQDVPRIPEVEAGPPKAPVLPFVETQPKAQPPPVVVGGIETQPHVPKTGIAERAEPWLKVGGVVLTGLQVAGIVGSGGALAAIPIGLGVVNWLVKRRIAQHQVQNGNSTPSQPGGAGTVTGTFPTTTVQPATVPRDLEQASEILQLAKREIGYSPLLAEYTGLVASDAIKNRIEAESNPLVKDALQLLQETINRKVSEDCPLTSKPTVFK